MNLEKSPFHTLRCWQVTGGWFFNQLSCQKTPGMALWEGITKTDEASYNEKVSVESTNRNSSYISSCITGDNWMSSIKILYWCLLVLKVLKTVLLWIYLQIHHFSLIRLVQRRSIVDKLLIALRSRIWEGPSRWFLFICFIQSETSSVSRGEVHGSHGEMLMFSNWFCFLYMYVLGYLWILPIRFNSPSYS